MNILQTTEAILQNKGFKFSGKDLSRPWGGFWVIAAEQMVAFVNTYFPEIDANLINTPISPKILMVAPNKKLSWQYHNRRSELWRVLHGTVGVVRSNDDQQGEIEVYHPGDKIQLAQGERHRLVGKNGWGMVAEIWVHTDADHLSDEDDIIRVSDDFGR